MISKEKIKYIQALHHKKYRQEYQQFIVEGEKIVLELWKHSPDKILLLYITEDFAQKHTIPTAVQIKAEDMKKITALDNPSNALAVVKYEELSTPTHYQGFSLYLDSIRDPGNMGTILRIADWFGVDTIYCSDDCVELYNPKVIQATMGAFLRVKLFKIQLSAWKKQHPAIPVWGAVLGGEFLHKNTAMPKNLLLVIGNESKGIQDENLNLLDKHIAIERFGGAESLNAAIATGIFCFFHKLS